MSQPWEIYDALLDGLPDDVVVRTAGQGPRWSRVLNSAGGVGTAWTMDVRSRPALSGDGPLDGRPLRDVGALAKSLLPQCFGASRCLRPSLSEP